jgi:hypothetical protein
MLGAKSKEVLAIPRKELFTASGKFCLPCAEKTPYRSRVKTAYHLRKIVFTTSGKKQLTAYTRLPPVAAPYGLLSPCSPAPYPVLLRRNIVNEKVKSFTIITADTKTARALP